MAKWIEDNMKTSKKVYPPEYGPPPMMQTRDFRPLPFGYGHGSSTLARWLETKANELYGETVAEYNEACGGNEMPANSAE